MISFEFVFTLLTVISTIVLVSMRPRWAAWASTLGAMITGGTFAYAWMTGGGTIIDQPFISAFGSRLNLTLDPLAAPLAVFVTGLAALIFCYTGNYLPNHLLMHNRSLAEQARFCRLMLTFMGTMVLLLLA